MELQQLADRVWVFPFDPALQDRQPNVGVVMTPSETVLIDSGAGPKHARQIRAALKSQAAPPVRYVIYTHHHFDHTFGAQIWEGSTVVAHEQCRRLLKEHYGSLLKSDLAADEQIHQDPARKQTLRNIKSAIGSTADFRIVPPEIVFSHDLNLSLDGLTLELRHVGGHHAADSITVLVQEASVMFLGDCYYPGPDHPEHDKALVERLAAQHAAHYVEGHDASVSHKTFARLFKAG